MFPTLIYPRLKYVPTNAEDDTSGGADGSPDNNESSTSTSSSSETQEAQKVSDYYLLIVDIDLTIYKGGWCEKDCRGKEKPQENRKKRCSINSEALAERPNKAASKSGESRNTSREPVKYTRL